MIRPSDHWIIDEALAAERAAPRAPSPTRRRRLPWLVQLMGAAVFVGLLVASHHLPDWAMGLRIAAFLWAAGLTFLKFTVWCEAERARVGEGILGAVSPDRPDLRQTRG